MTGGKHGRGVTIGPWVATGVEKPQCSPQLVTLQGHSSSPHSGNGVALTAAGPWLVSSQHTNPSVVVSEAAHNARAIVSSLQILPQRTLTWNSFRSITPSDILLTTA